MQSNIQPVKGTRDFYPEQMAVHNLIIDGWKSASVRNGFEEYEGPIFEYLKLFQLKSGEEIAEQLFSMEDRGGRALAIRPEMTPTLARMVNQRINALARPIKWFSVPRLCRAERPQKGRLREFFQWNIDIIGVDDVIADAEVIFCALDYLRQAGLTANDVVMKISSRQMLAELFEGAGVTENQLEHLYALLDKKSKLEADVFEKMLADALPDKTVREKIGRVMSAKSLEEIEKIVALNDRAKKAIDDLGRLFEILKVMGVGEFCEFDISIVRGLAYYTGAVFEVHDRAGELRAIGGGGRYDNLLRDFGGPSIPATGFGMGDCVLEILLEAKGLIKGATDSAGPDYFVVYIDEKLQRTAIEITAKLRQGGFRAEFSYRAAGLGKQLKQASAKKAAKCVILGDELSQQNSVAIKDMASGEQRLVKVDEFLSGIKAG